MTTACAHSRTNSVPPEKAYGTGIGEVSDPAKISDNGSSSSTTSGTYSTSSNFNSSSQSNSTYSTSATDTTAQTTLTQGTPTTTSATTVRQVALPNSSFPCESVTTATRPASAVTFYTLDPVSGVYLPAGTMSTAPSGTTSYYTYDTSNGWYTVSTSTNSGGSQIYVQDPSGKRMIPAGYAVVTTRPCGSAYVVTTTTTTSTPVNVSTTTNSVTPPPMTSSASTTVYTGPTIRPYNRGRSNASIDLFATRLQFRNSYNNMLIAGVPATGAIGTSFQKENGWGASLNGMLARMLELSVGASYIKPNVSYTPTIGGFGTLSGGNLTVIPINGSLNFHLLPEAFIDPYIGGGATYMMFRGSQNFNNAGGLGNTGLSRVSYDNAWGWHADGGVLFKFSHGFGINANARYEDVKPKYTTTFTTANGTTTGTFGTVNNSFHMKPWQFSLGLRFGF